MRPASRTWLLALLLPAQMAYAQAVFEATERVGTDTPEAWAMRYFAATTLMTSTGATAKREPWLGSVALDLGHIPRLDESQQRVGLGGIKSEDLNKSPVVGRLRLALGLPGDWVAELGYTPPVEIGGARARNLVALAIGRRLVQDGAFSLSMRAIGQVGQVEGDITCPARLAGETDRAINPYGCQAPSRDRFTTNHYGFDATLGWESGPWSWHASAGIVRAPLSVQVDAQLLATNERTRLTTNDTLPWFALGVRHDLDPRWSIAAEFLYVPLEVRRTPESGRDRDALGSLRVQLRRTFE